MYIDSHCHLNHNRLRNIGNVSHLVGKANDAGVEAMLTICCKIHEEMDALLAITQEQENVWCTVGTHPHDAGDETETAYTTQNIVEIANSSEKIIGIGESGLDYFYNNSEAEAQKASFRKHIRACIETELPLVVHARDADEDIIQIIKEESAGQKLTGVMHCFSSSRKMGEEALELGFYISFSGMVTFKNRTELHDFAKDVPLDRFLIETDAPFLAPEPYRGKINEPSFVIHTAKRLAELKSISEEEAANHSKQNFFNLFTKAKLA